MAPNSAIPNEVKQAAMLSYDIPKSIKMPNPSALLHRLGMFRINLSVWVGSLSAIACIPLDKWSEKGVAANVMRYEREDWEKVRALAEQSLESELDDLRTYIKKHIARATALLSDAEAAQSAKDVSRARGYVAGHARECKRRIAAAEASLLMFDLMSTREDILVSFREAGAAYQEAFETVHKQRAPRAPRAEKAAPEPEVELALSFLTATALGLKEVTL